MQVSLHLSPAFRLPHLQNRRVEITPGTTIRRLCKQVGINNIGVTVIEGRVVSPEHRLQEGEAIYFLPNVGGG